MPQTPSPYPMIHPFTSIAGHVETGPHIITEGKGVYLKDANGRTYIDAMAGLWCVNCGYGREEMIQAIADQARKLSYYHGFLSMATEPTIELADKLAQLAPGPLNKVFFGLSGSDANDTNIKLVWYYNNQLGRPKKKKIIARKKGYHGVTLGAASLSGLPALHAEFDLPINDRFIHVTAPHHYWDAPDGMTEREFSAHLAKELDERIEKEGPDTVAAFIAEPVMGAGGVVIPSEGYFDAIMPVLKKHDILFISDEVICGFGRLGSTFGCTHYNFQPDIMTVAKALTCGYVPMAASIVSDQVWEVLRDATGKLGMFSHGFTYSGHPLAAAAGLCSMELMQKDDWIGNARNLGVYFQQQLRDRFSDHPLVGEVRGTGLIGAVELVADKKRKIPFPPTEKMGTRCQLMLKEEGLLTRGIVNSMAFSPPLVINREELDLILERFSRGLDKLYATLR